MRTAMKISALALLAILVLATLPAQADVTGGGFIASSSSPSGKANFGINVTADANTLTYVDQKVAIVHATVDSVTYSGTTATLTGTATVKTPAGTSTGVAFTVVVTDAATPGRLGDTFSISLPSLSYSNSGALKGGNIKVVP